MLIRRNDTCVHLYTYRSTYLLSTCLSEMYLVLVPGTWYRYRYPETPASPMIMVEFAIATHEIRCLASFQVSSATFLCTYVPVPVPVPVRNRVHIFHIPVCTRVPYHSQTKQEQILLSWDEATSCNRVCFLQSEYHVPVCIYVSR